MINTDTMCVTKMLEEEIRPKNLMANYAKCLEMDIKQLLQYKDGFVYVNCPACNSRNSEEVFKKNELTYVTCLDCGTIYTNPRPTPIILDRHYAESKTYHYWNKYIFPASEEARREKIFKPRAERVASICHQNNTRTNTLLEVGAGFGTFCEEIDKLDIFNQIIAVEPTPDLAHTCRNKGLNVIEKPIEQVDLGTKSIDVIVSFEVIEHLFSPFDFLYSCKKLLSPNGLLILTCPNVRGFDIILLRSLSSTFGIEHLNYFHPTSLSLLALRCGFKVMEILTPGKLDTELVRKKALSGELDISTQPFLKYLLIYEWNRLGNNFQQFLADNLLSSHMWMVAQKEDLQ